MARIDHRSSARTTTRRRYLGEVLATGLLSLLPWPRRARAVTRSLDGFVVINGWILKETDLELPLDDR